MNARVVGSIAMVGWKCCTVCIVWLCKTYILKSTELSSSHSNSSHGRPACRCTVSYDKIHVLLFSDVGDVYEKIATKKTTADILS